jgi:hypothetical protein
MKRQHPHVSAYLPKPKNVSCPVPRLAQFPPDVLHQMIYDQIWMLWQCGNEQLNFKLEQVGRLYGRTITWIGEKITPHPNAMFDNFPISEIILRPPEAWFALGFHSERPKKNLIFERLMAQILCRTTEDLAAKLAGFDLTRLERLELSSEMVSYFGFVAMPNRHLNLGFGRFTLDSHSDFYREQLQEQLSSLKFLTLCMPRDVLVQYAGNQPFSFDPLYGVRSTFSITKEETSEKIANLIVTGLVASKYQPRPFWLIPPSLEGFTIFVPDFGHVVGNLPEKRLFWRLCAIFMALWMIPFWSEQNLVRINLVLIRQKMDYGSTIDQLFAMRNDLRSNFGLLPTDWSDTDKNLQPETLVRLKSTLLQFVNQNLLRKVFLSYQSSQLEKEDYAEELDPTEVGLRLALKAIFET